MSLTKVSYSMITGSPVSVLDFIPAAEHAAILNRTSTYDCHDAIISAIAALVDASQALYFPNGGYKTSSITIPKKGSNQAAALSFAGDGTGGYYMTSITLLTPSGVLFDFTGAGIVETQVAFQNLYLEGVSTSATGGTGIKLGSNATFSRFNNVSFIRFSTGMQLVSGCGFYYSSMRDLQFNYNYNYGLLADSGSLLNGVQFNSCSFSNTGTFTGDTPNHVGVGVSITSGSADICFSSCYAENNSGYGMYLSGFYNAKFDACYYELNGNSDIYCECNVDYPVAQVEVNNSYFDPDTNRSHPYRIYFNGAIRPTLNNNKLMATSGGSPPVFYYPIYTGGGYKGLYTGIALNNEYPTATLTNLPDDGEWFIIDSKHPMVQFASVTPAQQTVKAGGLVFNTTETTLATGTLGWLTTTTGRTGGLPTNTATATTIAGNSNITVNDTANTFMPGDVVQVAGVTWFNPDLSNTAYTTILYAPDPTNWTTSGAANNSVSGAAITYRAGTVTPLAKIPLENGLALVPGLEIGDASSRLTKRDAAITTNSVLVISTQISGKNTGNHTIVSGKNDATGAAVFIDIVTWITNGGAPTVTNTNETGTPAARTYAINTTALNLSMGGGAAYTVTAVNTMLGY